MRDYPKFNTQELSSRNWTYTVSINTFHATHEITCLEALTILA